MSLNRTNVELKQSSLYFSARTSAVSQSYQRGIETLVLSTPQVFRCSLNRTNVELKPSNRLAVKSGNLALNRTNVELKPFKGSTVVRDTDDSQSYQRGIETISICR